MQSLLFTVTAQCNWARECRAESDTMVCSRH